ncbi:Binding [Hibiscus syriacus]|uniref:Binding n=1 Tax=Hibiscus syriacus TaxID=106335 RepID=A0A6A3CDV4_HIBSY|nr:Binding [Hibiscus syriacus]
MMSSSCENTRPNLVSWTAVIGGFSQNGYDEEAIEMFFRMVREGIEPNVQTLASVLPACARLQKLSLGKEFHGYITRHRLMSNPIVVNGLIDVYRRCCDVTSSFQLFSKFPRKNVVSCNTKIDGYCENGHVSKAKALFDQMRTVGIKKDIISWNTLISEHVNNSLLDGALNLFNHFLTEEGIEPDSFTLGSVLSAFTDMASLRLGKEIHTQAIVRVSERDTTTWNALISGYARFNQIEDIQHLLRKMKEDGFEPNVYTWNGIIAGHVENELNDKAMQLFSEMQTSNMRHDIYTIGIILPACSISATIERGKQVHAHAIRCGYDADVYIGEALVDMYAKCGSIQHALLAYNRILEPNLVSHNAMLTSYAMHGHGEERIALFRRIIENGCRPDHVTFLSALSSCVHVRSIEMGRELFDLMQHYDIKPTIKQYTCMIDLLSRAGQFTEAYKLINRVPVEVYLVMWVALLGGCVLHSNVELGEVATKRLIALETNNTANYALLANLYAHAGKWSDLLKVMVDPQVVSPVNSPGNSSVFPSNPSCVQHILKHDTIKLVKNTYLLWTHQVALILNGYGLMKYITPDSVIPSEWITTESGQVEENPSFFVYRQQDKLLASWLLTTEHISVVLAGLSMEFEFIIAITSRDTLSLEVHTEMLLDCEARQKVFLSDGISANMVVRSSDIRDVPVKLCGKFGHTVQKCYHRFDRDFIGVTTGEALHSDARKKSSSSNDDNHLSHSPSPRMQAYTHFMASPYLTGLVYSPYLYPGALGMSTLFYHGFLYSSFGYLPADTRFSSSTSNVPSTAFVSALPGASSSVSTHSTAANALWYPDTGVTHHVLNDLSVFDLTQRLPIHVIIPFSWVMIRVFQSLILVKVACTLVSNL